MVRWDEKGRSGMGAGDIPLRGTPLTDVGALPGRRDVRAQASVARPAPGIHGERTAVGP